MFTIGQKVVLERTPIYASSHGGTLRQYTKEIAKVHETGAVQFKGQRNYKWFALTNDGEFLETKTIRYRIIKLQEFKA